MRKNWKMYLILMNTLALALFMMSFGGKSSFKTLEVGQLILSSPDTKASIELGFKGNVAQIVMKDEVGNSVLEMEAGKEAAIVLRSEKNVLFKASQKEGHGFLELSDPSGAERLSMKTGKNSGIFMKNEANKTIGTWTILSDGGAGFGLADKNGGAATILRGGSSPSVSFFTEQNEPMAAMGMIQRVPHLLISGPIGNEGILIHGGKPSSMVFVDELGKVKILISKNGVFQGKQQAAPPQEKKENRVFSFDDKNVLFPETPEIHDNKAR